MSISRKELRTIISEAVSEAMIQKYATEYMLGMDQEGEFRMLVQKGMDPKTAIQKVVSPDMFDGDNADDLIDTMYDEFDYDEDIDDYDTAIDDPEYYEFRRQEELDDIYYSDRSILHSIIKDAQAIDYMRLVGEVRKNKYLSKYDSHEILAMLSDLSMKGSIDYDLESGQWTVL